MNYIDDNGFIDLSVLDAREYTAFQGKFIEDIDPHLADLVLDDVSTFKVPDLEYIKEIDGEWNVRQKQNISGDLLWVKDEQGNEIELPRFSPESKILLKKRTRLLKNGNQLEIFYQQKKGLGRFYSNDDLSLTCLARNIRNTIYHYQSYIDYDFVASHPTILSCIAVKLRISTPNIDAWVANKKPIIKLLSDHHSVAGQPPLQKDQIKKLINSALYGGGLECWAMGGKDLNGNRKGGVITGNPAKNEMPMQCKNWDNWTMGHSWYKAFKAEVKKITETLIGANPLIKERVSRTSDPDFKKNNSTISYILGIFENECLYHAYQYGIDNELITHRRANLAYDGFATPAPPPYTDHAFHLNAVNGYIFEKTGFKMRIEVKPFESWTIQNDLIDVRRAMLVAVPVNPIEAMTLDGGAAVAEQEEDSLEDSLPQEYRIWKEQFERLHTKVINSSTYFKKIYEELPNGEQIFKGYKIMNRTDLVNAYEHEWFIKTCPATGKKKKEKFITEWITDRHLQTKLDTDILPPPMFCPVNILNLWRPSEYFGRDILPTDTRYNQVAVDLWLNHIGVMCDRDVPATEYVINWFAHLLQKPAEKSTHLIITGKQGTGKTIALAPIKKIMGGGYFESTKPERDVWGQFNPMMASSLLVVLSETDKRNAYGAEGIIKALITDPEITINDKGIKPFVVRSFHRFITPTNHFDPVKLEKGERRNVIIKTSDEFKENWDYFANFARVWDDDHACLSLYSFLMARDITHWNFRVIPKTEYHNELVSFNRNPLDEFVEWLVAKAVVDNWETDADGCFQRYGSEMMTYFRAWRDEFGGKYDVNGTGDLIKKITCSLDLPKGCLVKGTRSARGQKGSYNLALLKKHYKIGCLLDLGDLSGGASVEVEDEMEDEMEGEMEGEGEVENVMLGVEDENEDEMEDKVEGNYVEVNVGGTIQRLKCKR